MAQIGGSDTRDESPSLLGVFSATGNDRDQKQEEGPTGPTERERERGKLHGY